MLYLVQIVFLKHLVMHLSFVNMLESDEESLYFLRLVQAGFVDKLAWKFLIYYLDH